MEDDSTTGTDDQAAAADGSKPADSQPDAAGSPGSDDKPDTSKSADEPAGGDKPAGDDKTADDSALKFDDDLDDWAEKAGHKKPTDDANRKVLQELRNERREFSRAQEAKKAVKGLEDATGKMVEEESPDDDEDPIEARLAKQEERARQTEIRLAQSEYFSENNVSQPEVDHMTAILKEKVDRAIAKGGNAEGKKVLDYWTDPDNLVDWHSLAQARVAAGTSTEEIKSEAAQAERERIEKESKAGGAQRDASNTTTSDKTLEQQRKERFSTGWRD